MTVSWRRWAIRALVLGAVVFVGPVALFRFVDPPTTAFMLRRRWTARAEKGFVLQYRFVPLQHISKNLSLAVIAGEDQKFLSHHGFDVDSMLDAAERSNSRPMRGASTLTQQVAKNLFLWSGRSIIRKGLEAVYTVLIEALWPKRRILEMHLNIAEFGNGIYGAEAASQRLFQKSAANLTMSEASLLAAVLPSPRKRSPLNPSAAVIERAAWIEDQATRLSLERLK
jgi:monofunctional glycosyltransferase